MTQKFLDATKEGKISRREWKIANKCRLYRQVLTVSDIVTGDGNRLEEWVLDRTCRGQEGRIRQVNWPQQGMPNQNDWKVWNKVLSVSLYEGNQCLIWEKLWGWFEKIVSSAIPNWKWFWNKENASLY